MYPSNPFSDLGQVDVHWVPDAGCDSSIHPGVQEGLIGDSICGSDRPATTSGSGMSANITNRSINGSSCIIAHSHNEREHNG